MEEFVENDSTKEVTNEEPADTSQEEQQAVDTELEASDEKLDDTQSMEDMMDIYEESFKRFAEGEVVIGKIISVDKDHVLVDIGYKSEGQINIHEFKDENGNINAQVDDSVEVMVEWWDDENEVVMLSKEKAAKVKVWEDIKKAHDADETVEGIIMNRVKGGFSVDIGVQAFLPGSQIALRRVPNIEDLLGQKYDFKIIKLNKRRRNIVVSRRVILEGEREKKRATLVKELLLGQVREGQRRARQRARSGDAQVPETTGLDDTLAERHYDGVAPASVGSWVVADKWRSDAGFAITWGT